MKLTDIKKLKVSELRSRLQELGLDSKGLKAELLGRLWSALEAGRSVRDGDEDVKLQDDGPPTSQQSVEVCDPSPAPPRGAGVTERRKPDCTREYVDTATQTETDTSLRSLWQQGSECVPTLQQGSDCVSIQQQQQQQQQQQGSGCVSTLQQGSGCVSTLQGSGCVSTLQQGSGCVSTLQGSECVSTLQQGSDCVSTLQQGSDCVSTQQQQQGSGCVSTLQQGSGCVSTLQQGSECVSTLQQGSGCVSTLQQVSECVSTLQQVSERVSDCAPVCQVEERDVEMQHGGAEDPGEDRRAEKTGRGRAFYEFKEEIRYKRAKSPQPPVDREETEEEDEDKVRLDPYDSHLHFEVGPDGACGQPRFWARFPSLWSGCRVTHGVLRGRVGFEVRLERKLLTAQLEEQDDVEPCGLRVGWSMANASLLLGEDDFSFAYDGHGKKVSGGKEEEFGELFSEGDIIGCYASFTTDGAVELSFHKNGRVMGEAFSLDASVLLARPLFPHVLCKNCSVRLLLDPTSPPWYPGPPGFTPLAALPAGQRVRTTKMVPPTLKACEVLVMVGLPGSGKSHWARTHIKQHPEKQYKLLGTEELLACMIRGGRRDSRLQQASQCLTDLIKMAAQTPGNYILDQCNILFSARRHKLQLFTGFRRRVVVVFPSADEWKRRLSLHQASNGEAIPETALLKLQVSCSLPEQQSNLQEELQYVELPQEQAQVLLQEYCDEARRLLPPIPKQKQKPRLQKKRPHPHGPPPARWNDSRLNVHPWRQPRYWSYQDPGYYSRDVGYSGYEGYW